MICPYCGLDPYEYIDVGIGYIPVAVNCCEAGYDIFATDKTWEEVQAIHGTPEEWRARIEEERQRRITENEQPSYTDDIPF